MHRSVSITPTEVIRPRARFLPQAPAQAQRGYRAAAALGGLNADWALIGLKEDADVYINWRALLMRSRDLAKDDVFFQKYRMSLWSNVLGSKGHTLRMNIRHPDGTPDVAKGKAVEAAWKAWGKKKTCSVGARHSYQVIRQLRVWLCARDGECFIRMVRDMSLNRFSFGVQIIQTENCPHELNQKLDNGNTIKMGIEYEPHFGRPVAYYFVRTERLPDFRVTTQQFWSMPSSIDACDRVPANEVIHFCQYVDGEQTRPAPWTTPVILLSRHLGKYQEAEVVAARVQACKLGFFTSDIMPAGGTLGSLPDPTTLQDSYMNTQPGSFTGLPYGVKFETFDPTHANGNFEAFRKGVLKSWCAGLPGANYNTIANDLEGVNYSSGRLGMLDEREMWKVVQELDIESAENEIFEQFLLTQMVNGVLAENIVDLGFDAVNEKEFSGRRWAWVDPEKEARANQLEISNRMKSPSRIMGEQGMDFEEEVAQMAQDIAFMRANGIEPPQSPEITDTETEQQEPENNANSKTA